MSADRYEVLITETEYRCRAFLKWWRCQKSESGLIELRGDRIYVKPKSQISDEARVFVRKYKEIIKALLRLEEALDPPFTPDGYVYVLQAGPYCKIGRTTALDKRLAKLKIQLPFKAEVVHTIACKDHQETEKFLHDRFSCRRTNGEWFQLTDKELDFITSIKAMSGEVIVDVDTDRHVAALEAMDDRSGA